MLFKTFAHLRYTNEYILNEIESLFTQISDSNIHRDGKMNPDESGGLIQVF